MERLGRQLARGEANLAYTPGLGYLPDLLKKLGVNPDSQALVFSKTSFQQGLISPQNPRAVYFNDDVAVGYVPGGEVFELSALDPDHGPQFYVLSTHQADRPHFETRDEVCLSCHGPVNQVVPGLMVTSVIPDSTGKPFFTGAFFNITDQRTPIADRWGGWYVDGSVEANNGNQVASDPDKPTELNTNIAGKFDTSKYPVPTSDVVALMTLEHQTRIINLITGISAQMRNLTPADRADPKISKRVDAAIEEMTASLLFADEAELHQPVKGASSFSKTFPELGPRDKQGRSLRDFDLQRRLFRYPLSYMIYDPIFDNMEETLKDRIYRRLFDVLSGKDTAPKFAKLSASDRKAILEIVRETKPDLPDYWK